MAQVHVLHDLRHLYEGAAVLEVEGTCCRSLMAVLRDRYPALEAALARDKAFVLDGGGIDSPLLEAVASEERGPLPPPHWQGLGDPKEGKALGSEALAPAAKEQVRQALPEAQGLFLPPVGSISWEITSITWAVSCCP